MLNRIRSAGIIALTACALMAASCSPSADKAPEPRTEFNIGWSIYAGWMPWPYAQQSGIVKKWADKYGLKINFVQVNDYVESVNQYTAGKLDGVTVANMDALTIPAAGGKDTSAIIVGDYSNGNDGILLKGANALAAIKGRKVYLAELSVSHYLLALTSPIADNISANGVGLVLGMLFRFAFYRWWVFSPARSAAGRAAAKAGADEPAPITAPTLAGSPDGGLVGD